MADSPAAPAYRATLAGAVNATPETAPDPVARALAGQVAWEEQFDSLAIRGGGDAGLEVVAERQRWEGRRWDLVGAALVVVGLLGSRTDVMLRLSWNLQWLVFVVVVGLGVALAWRGRPARVREQVVVGWVVPNEGLMGLRRAATDERPPAHGLDRVWDVEQVLYARRRVQEPSGAVSRSVAGLFVRFIDGSVWPLAAGVRNEEQAWRVGQAFARALHVPMKEVGRGWSDAPARRSGAPAAASARPWAGRLH
jgi:hypothetical protein